MIDCVGNFSPLAWNTCQRNPSGRDPRAAYGGNVVTAGPAIVGAIDPRPSVSFMSEPLTMCSSGFDAVSLRAV